MAIREWFMYLQTIIYNYQGLFFMWNWHNFGFDECEIWQKLCQYCYSTDLNHVVLCMTLFIYIKITYLMFELDFVCYENRFSNTRTNTFSIEEWSLFNWSLFGNDSNSYAELQNKMWVEYRLWELLNTKRNDFELFSFRFRDYWTIIVIHCTRIQFQVRMYSQLIDS